MLKPLLKSLAGLTPWSLVQLFNSGADGFYSPLDPLYQTTDTSTPVTAVGETIGRFEDVSGNGNHPIQASGTARMRRGQIPMGGRKNKLGERGGQSEGSTGWTATRATLTPGDDGILMLVAETTDAGTHAVAPFSSNGVFTSGAVYTGFAIVKKSSALNWMQFYFSTGFQTTVWKNINLDTGAAGNSGGGELASDIQPVPPALVSQYPELNGAYIIMLQATANSSVTNSAGFVLAFCGDVDSASRAPAYAGDTAAQFQTTRLMVVEGARDIDWYIANYQKVTAAWDVTQGGAPSLRTAWADGLDDQAIASITEVNLNAIEIFYALAFQHNTGAITANQTLLAVLRNDNNSNFFQIFLDSADGKIYASLGAPGRAEGPVCTSGLHVLLAWYSGGTIFLRVDGVEYTASASPGSVLLNRISIGCRGNNTPVNYAAASIVEDIVVRFGTVPPVHEILRIERAIAQKVGVALP